MPKRIWAWMYQSAFRSEIHRQWAPNKISDSDSHETEYVDAVVAEKMDEALRMAYRFMRGVRGEVPNAVHAAIMAYEETKP